MLYDIDKNMININLEKTNKIFDKLVAHIGSFLWKIIQIIIPLRYPVLYKGDDMDEFKRTLSSLGDKSLLAILTSIDLYIWIKMADDLKSRISWKEWEPGLVCKMQWVADLKDVISKYVEVRSIQK